VTKNILITGFPGVGKTTLIKRLCEEPGPENPVGFYTEEIREGTVRKGFRLISFAGESGVLSHVSIRSSSRVGKYGVDVAGFEKFLEKIDLLGGSSNQVVIDEIGKMECLSKKFVHILQEILDSDKTVVATIAARGGGVISQVKQRDDITLLEITRKNRDSMIGEIAGLLRQRL
jgi:nucleoside-triphosphatase